MRTRTLGFITGLIIAAPATAWFLYAPGCETVLPGLKEARSIAQDAKDSADLALEQARAANDPAAIQVAQDASQKADAALQAAQAAEKSAVEWAEKIQSGEITPQDGQDIGGMIGNLIAGPRGGVIGTMLGGVAAGWYYRRIAKQIVQGVDGAKAASPTVADGFKTDAVRDAISSALSPAAYNFVEKHRV